MAVANRITAASRDHAPSVIDEDHLGRMTLGDRRLEREVLEIFVRQSTMMLGRIAGAPPALAAAAAHTLTGSARGIGAWRVASAAERLEGVATGQGGDAGMEHDIEHDMEQALAELRAASLEASAAIGARLGGTRSDL